MNRPSTFITAAGRSLVVATAVLALAACGNPSGGPTGEPGSGAPTTTAGTTDGLDPTTGQAGEASDTTDATGVADTAGATGATTSAESGAAAEAEHQQQAQAALRGGRGSPGRGRADGRLDRPGPQPSGRRGGQRRLSPNRSADSTTPALQRPPGQPGGRSRAPGRPAGENGRGPVSKVPDGHTFSPTTVTAGEALREGPQ